MSNLMITFGVQTEKIAQLFSQSLGVWYLIIFNTFGILAIVFKMSETQLKRRSLIITFASISTGCWMCYYLLNGNLTSALISVIAIIKYIIFAQREKHKWADSKWWLYGFLVVQIIVGVLTYKNWTSIFAVSAGILGTFAYFTVSQRNYRWILLCCQTCWVINGAFNLYYVALIADSLATISIITAIVRFYVLDKKKEQNSSTDSSLEKEETLPEENAVDANKDKIN